MNSMVGKHEYTFYGMYKKMALLLAIVLVGGGGFRAEATMPVDSIESRLAEQLYQYPQEKIHVTTDRSSYVAGDTIWLRAFVVNAADNRQVDVSRYVYAELVTPFNTVESRVKIIKRNSAYYGYIPLNGMMAEGDYTLSAYTLFMQNAGADFFFKKNIHIASPFSSNSKIDVATDDSDSDKLKLTLNYRDKHNRENKRYENATITLPDGKELQKGFNTQSVKLQLDTADIHNGCILARFNNYSKYITIPRQTTDKISLTFHPEGGYMIPDTECRIAFKAIGTDGLSREVSGKITDDKGNTIANFSTLHFGMGTVTFLPKAGTKYTAVYSYNGKEYTTTLPQADKNAAALRIRQTTDSIEIAAQGNIGKGSIVMLQVRGNFVYSIPISNWTSDRIAKSAIPAGVAQVLLLDKDGNKLSERLIFSKNGMQTPTEVTTNSRTYKTRQKVSINVALPEKGDYSVAVTDNNASQRDTTVNILSNLLLQSDLKGNIEQPAWYFENQNTEEVLDALMLTQGWTRYDIPSAIRGDYTYPTYPIEAGAEITGIVKSLWRNKPLKGATVNTISPKTGFASSGITDADGRFYITGADYPDSTKYILNAFNAKGKSEMNLTIDEYQFPKTTFSPIAQPYGNESDSETALFSRLQNNPNFRSILLEELTVIGRKPKIPEDAYQALSYRSFDYRQLESEGITSYDEFIRQIPGLRESNDNLIYRNSSVVIFVDGVYIEPLVEIPEEALKGGIYQHWYLLETPFEKLQHIPIENVRRIDFLRPGEAVIFGSKASGGALMVFTKKGGEDIFSKQPPELKMTTPLGYQKPAEFYSPRYTAEQAANPDGSDMRTTVYWNPRVMTDVQGKSQFEFYTTDIPNTTYNVRIEGLTENGRIISTDKTITVE